MTPSPDPPFPPPRRRAGWWQIAALWLALAPAASAHPHAELDYSVAFHLDRSQVTAVTLTFHSSDEVFLGFFLQDYDRNRDGLLDPDELARAERNLFREWRRHGFFALWETEGRRFRLYRADETSLTFDPVHGLTAQVTLLPPEPFQNSFSLSVFDPDYFHNLELAPDPIEIKGEPDVTLTWQPRINRNVTFYYGQLHPVELLISLQPASLSPQVIGPGGVSGDIATPDLTLPTWDETPGEPASPQPPAADSPTEPPPTGVVFARAESPGGWTGWLRWLNFQQQAVREWMADLRLQAQEEGRFSPYLWMVLASFLYGIIHAAGPGHGKAALAAYFAGSRTGRWRACGVATLTAFLHAGSGMALVWIVHGLLDEAVQGFLPEATRWTQSISASMILVLGLLLAGLAWRRLIRPAAPNRTPPTHQHRSWPIILAIGLIPCPATVLVFLFCLSFNAPALGVALVLALAAGMATCLIGIALLASTFGSTARALAARKTGSERAAAGLELASGAALAVLGTILLISSVAALRPGWS